VPAARADALVERVQRAGLADRGPARLDERAARPHRALLGDVTVGRGAGPGLAHARIETEVAGELARVLERSMSPIAARKLAATITLTPGTLINRRISFE
jgi:hypothetical protein